MRTKTSAILVTAAVSLLTSVASLFAFYNLVPLSVLQPQASAPSYGSTITTIQGSDTLSSSRTTINNNFAALNTGKFELSDWYATTSASQLTTLGTITTGTWHASTLTVPYGGTGSTTLSQYQVLLGNATGGLTVVPGWGTSGQLLTSNGAGAAPTWQSATFDTTQNYTLTGRWIFATSTAYTANFGKITATSSVDLPASWVLNTVSYTYPASQGAAQTSLVNNGSGTLSWGHPVPPRYAYASTSQSVVPITTTMYGATTTVPSGTLSASTTITVVGTFEVNSTGNNANGHVQLVDTNGNTYFDVQLSPSPGASSFCTLSFIAKLIARSISTQGVVLTGTKVCNTTTSSVNYMTDTSVNWSGAIGFSLHVVDDGNGSGSNNKMDGYTVEINP